MRAVEETRTTVQHKGEMIVTRFGVCVGILMQASSGLSARTQQQERPREVDVPMSSTVRQAPPLRPGADKTEVRFFGHEGFPQGVMELNSGVVALEGLNFSNGMIEFDMKLSGRTFQVFTFLARTPRPTRMQRSSTSAPPRVSRLE